MAETNNNFIFDIIDGDLGVTPELKIHTRFPPEPNGYLHIGSVKAICINTDVANKYQGLFNLRYDDNVYICAFYRKRTIFSVYT